MAARLEAWLLLGASQRWEHVSGVAAAAADAASAVRGEEADLHVAAAWLHDIGYAAGVAETGFHPLDGGRYLRRMGWPEPLCTLVAHHTAALVEAEARGLADVLIREFPPVDSPTSDALTFADMTTGPTGQRVDVEERIAEILERYDPGHVVHESIRRNAPTLIATVRRVEARLVASIDQRPA